MLVYIGLVWVLAGSAIEVTGVYCLYPRYSHILTPYMSSVPAVIAKASAIHNPIIYAITHPKYRCGHLGAWRAWACS